MAMRCLFFTILILIGINKNFAQGKAAVNPVIWADVPDMSMIRVGDTYYMSSTTMHLTPGVPIMKSKDLVNWQMVSYACTILGDSNELNLTKGKSTYGRGSWASSLRYHKGIFYVTTFAQTTGKTYIYTTGDIENGPWVEHSFQPAYHDHTLFFENDHVYLIYGNGKLKLVELKEDLSGTKEGSEVVLIENASSPAGTKIMLGAEGSQLFKVNDQYYLFNITWPRGGMRTVILHRADRIYGPYEGRVAFQDKGVAQGGLIDTPDGKWFAYLFRDNGAVGRIPYLVPVQWKDGWPILGVEGKAPDQLELPACKGLIPGLVASDDFSRKKGENALPLVWQWNHNPDQKLWSVRDRKGFLRLKTGRIDSLFVLARNTLTQRTFGPACAGSVSIDVSKMKIGDFAGLALMQKKYGLVGVSVGSDFKSIVMVSAETGKEVIIQKVRLDRKKVFLKAECNFVDKMDKGRFLYSLNGEKWFPIGKELKMEYTIPHFMGYRFGLFNYATFEVGGYADFDWFKTERLANVNF